jgi:hypothetical protein
VIPGQAYEPTEVRDRVRARFPDLAPLLQRPELDALVERIGLRWDDRGRRYRAPAVGGGETTGLESRPATRVATTVPVIGPGAVGQRLEDSRKSRSFVALGVSAPWLERFTEVLRARFDVVELDLTHALMDALHATAANAGVPWSEVLGADADVPGSRPRQGLHALLQRSLPAVRQAIEQALTTASSVDHGVGRPVLLLDPSLLARYDALGELAPWLDLTTKRPTAVWLVVPQVHGNVGPVCDGRPLPLTAPSQYVPVPAEWIQTYRTVPAAPTPVPEGTFT